MRKTFLVLLAVLFALPAMGQKRSIIRQPVTEIYPVRESVHECALGRSIGCRTVLLHGLNVDIGATIEDIWSGGGLYAFYPTVAIEIGCESDNANDTVLGTGARTLKINGLDANRNGIIETIDMNGTTQVVVSNKMIRVNFIRVQTQGGGVGRTNEGTIFCEATTGGGGVSAGDGVPSSDDAQQILPGQGLSAAAIYTVPANKTAVFTAVSFQVGKGNQAELAVFYRLNNATVGDDGAWGITLTAFLYENAFQIDAGTVAPAPPGTDIRVVGSKATGGGTVPVSAHFGLVLYDYVKAQ